MQSTSSTGFAPRDFQNHLGFGTEMRRGDDHRLRSDEDTTEAIQADISERRWCHQSFLHHP